MKTHDTTFIIRDASPDELDDVARVTKEAYKQYRDIMPPDAWKNYAKDQGDVRGRFGKAEIMVAEVNGRLAGTVTLYSKNSEPTEMGWLRGWAAVRLLAVHPKYRGLGIGRALMEEVLRRCRERGIRTVGLHTNPGMDIAVGLYERMGFKRVPQYDFHPRPGVVVMAYRLDL